MSNPTRKLIMEWTVQGHPMQSKTVETNLPEWDVVQQLLRRHWPEGHKIPVRIECFEEKDGQKVKTNHYDSFTFQYV